MTDLTLGDHGRGTDPHIFCVKSRVVIKILGFGVRVPVSKYQLNTLPVFSSSRFLISGLIFRSLIHKIACFQTEGQWCVEQDKIRTFKRHLGNGVLLSMSRQ